MDFVVVIFVDVITVVIFDVVSAIVNMGVFMDVVLCPVMKLTHKNGKPLSPFLSVTSSNSSPSR